MFVFPLHHCHQALLETKQYFSATNCEQITDRIFVPVEPDVCFSVTNDHLHVPIQIYFS